MKIFTLILSLVCFSLSLLAQAPASFKYQAVARQADNTPYSNTEISIRINVLQGDVNGSSVFEETTPVTTSDLGLFSINVGAVGNDLALIDWSAGPYFIQVEMDPAGGSAFEMMGTSEVLSVPTAIYAEKAGNIGEAIQTLSVDQVSQTLMLSGGGSIPLSDLSNDLDSDPQNELQSIFIDPATQSLVLTAGGSIPLSDFGFSNGMDADSDPSNEIQTLSWNGANQEISISNGNSITIPLTAGEESAIIVDSDGDTKVVAENKNNNDKVLIELDGNEEVFFQRTTTNSLLMQFPNNSKNTFIGNGAGTKNQYGPDSSGVIRGDFNTFLGNISGTNNTTGKNNTFVGHRSGNLSRESDFNTYYGSQAGAKLSVGSFNTLIGGSAGSHITTGIGNTFLGYASGGTSLNEGDDNTIIGHAAGASGGRGGFNTYIGAKSGRLNKEGGYNVFLGFSAGLHEAGSHKLYIANSPTLKPLIYGDFEKQLLRIYGQSGLEIYHGLDASTDGFAIQSDTNDSLQWRMYVDHTSGELKLFSSSFSETNGSASNVASINAMTGEFSSLSDRTVKTNVEALNSTLGSLLQLQAYKYHFLGNEEAQTKSIGFMAQDIKRYFPELVTLNSDNNLHHLNYTGLGVIAIKAIQEQQTLLQDQNTKIENLESKVQSLEERLAKIVRLLNK